MANEFYIFDEGYCALQKRESSDTKDNLPIGYLVVNGTDAAAIKRKDSADSWAKGYRADRVLPSITIKNTPAVGFKLTGGTRTASQGGGETAFRISDPRGVELEIRASNLCLIMNNTTIERSEILEECVWARYGSTMWLLPTSSPEYEEAVASTRRKHVTVSPKDVKPGHIVVLHNGIKGVYLGAHTSWRKTYSNVDLSSSKKHFILCNETHYNKNVDVIRIIGTPKYAELIDNTTTLTSEECAIKINQHRSLGGYFGEAKAGSIELSTLFVCVSTNKPEYTFEPAEPINSDNYYAYVKNYIKCNEGIFEQQHNYYYKFDHTLRRENETYSLTTARSYERFRTTTITNPVTYGAFIDISGFKYRI